MDEIQILIDGVRGPPIPVGQNVTDVRLQEENTSLDPIEIPGFARTDMVIERAGIILR
jgi:hypothetical protein